MSLNYPVGNYDWPASLNIAERQDAIAALEYTPARLRSALAGLDDAQLNTPYREGGWTVRQVVHHLADSHMHSYIRCKFALSEDQPTVKPYDEKVWANYEDAIFLPPAISLRLLESLHTRWVRWWRSLSNGDFDRVFLHPENGPMRLDVTLGLYAWHSRHHTAHITGLRDRMGW